MTKNGFNNEKIYKIPLGVDNIDVLKVSEQIMAKDNYFLFVGRIVERKGLSWFVLNVLPLFKNMKLKVVGPIVDKEEFKKITNNDQVEYLGTVDNKKLNDLRLKSKLCIVPNILLNNLNDFEAFCFVTIESIAGGSMVLASEYQGIKDALFNGQIGFLAKPSDTSDWVNKINKILKFDEQNVRDKLTADMKFINKNLNWKGLFLKTQDLHRKIN